MIEGLDDNIYNRDPINTGKLISDVWNMDGWKCEQVLRI